MESSDEEEDGRSRVGKRSRQSDTGDLGALKSQPKGEDIAQDHNMSEQQPSKNAKRGSSYLDQVLAQRSAKQQKKKQKASSKA